MSEQQLGVVIVGDRARDDALAAHLEGSKIHAVYGTANPGLIEKVEVSGGQHYLADDLCNGEVIASFAADVLDGHKGPKMVYVSGDAPLAAGVINAVQRHLPDVLTVGPRQEAAKLESDKFLTRTIVDEIDKEYGTDYNPIWFPVTTRDKLTEAIDSLSLDDILAVVKPRNLAGGRGVKVMLEHLKTYEEAQAYGEAVLINPNQTGVSIEERIDGFEFTLMLWTDGKIMILPKTTYDFPFRDDGDSGPPTGSMGTFTMADGLLPFLSQEKFDEAVWLASKIQEKARDRGLDINGVFYGSFFITKDGKLKFTEANVRAGEPELVNNLEEQEDDVDMAQVLINVATGESRSDDIRYKQVATTLINLVAPDYARDESESTYEFDMDINLIRSLGVKVYFTGAKKIGQNRYRVGSSRAVALIARGETPWAARELVLEAIQAGVNGPLDHRFDVGDRGYIEALPKAA